jgi:hypothetical protein
MFESNADEFKKNKFQIPKSGFNKIHFLEFGIWNLKLLMVEIDI